MARKSTGVYPPDWPAFAKQMKDACGWRCVRCDHPHDPASGYTLTVHHLTMRKDEPFTNWWAFLPLCQRCHLSIQGRVYVDRPWVMSEHSEWFRIYAAGFYAHKYLGLDLTRAETEARLPELLSLERAAVLGEVA